MEKAHLYEALYLVNTVLTKPFGEFNA